MEELISFSAEHTGEIGYKLGRLLKRGDIVCLTGDLGTGKTAFTGGIAKALSINSYITSPTFTIVNEYKSDIPLFHFDVYRIGSSDELYDIGFDEYIDSCGVVVIEWADMVKDIIPPENIWVDIRKDLSLGLDARKISIEFNGERYRGYMISMEESIKPEIEGSEKV